MFVRVFSLPHLPLCHPGPAVLLLSWALRSDEVSPRKSLRVSHADPLYGALTAHVGLQTPTHVPQPSGDARVRTHALHTPLGVRVRVWTRCMCVWIAPHIYRVYRVYVYMQLHGAVPVRGAEVYMWDTTRVHEIRTHLHVRVRTRGGRPRVMHRWHGYRVHARAQQCVVCAYTRYVRVCEGLYRSPFPDIGHLNAHLFVVHVRIRTHVRVCGNLVYIHTCAVLAYAHPVDNIFLLIVGGVFTQVLWPMGLLSFGAILGGLQIWAFWVYSLHM